MVILIVCVFGLHVWKIRDSQSKEKAAQDKIQDLTDGNQRLEQALNEANAGINTGIQNSAAGFSSVTDRQIAAEETTIGELESATAGLRRGIAQPNTIVPNFVLYVFFPIPKQWQRPEGSRVGAIRIPENVDAAAIQKIFCSSRNPLNELELNILLSYFPSLVLSIDFQRSAASDC